MSPFSDPRVQPTHPQLSVTIPKYAGTTELDYSYMQDASMLSPPPYTTPKLDALDGLLPPAYTAYMEVDDSFALPLPAPFIFDKYGVPMLQKARLMSQLVERMHKFSQFIYDKEILSTRQTRSLFKLARPSFSSATATRSPTTSSTAPLPEMLLDRVNTYTWNRKWAMYGASARPPNGGKRTRERDGYEIDGAQPCSSRGCRKRRLTEVERERRRLGAFINGSWAVPSGHSVDQPMMLDENAASTSTPLHISVPSLAALSFSEGSFMDLSPHLVDKFPPSEDEEMLTPHLTTEWAPPPPPFSTYEYDDALPSTYWEPGPPRYSLSDTYPDLLVPSRDRPTPWWSTVNPGDWFAATGKKDVTMMDWGALNASTK